MKMHTHGVIIAINEQKRIVIIQSRKDQKHLYFQRAMFNQYFKYLNVHNRITVSLKVSTPTRKVHKYTVLDVYKITSSSARTVRILYSQERVSTDTQTFVNSLKTKMFLDLEMTMHPYKYDKDFVQEIIQVGYVIADENDQILEKYMTFVKPTLYPTLTKRTLKFLELNQEDVDQGIAFSSFYEHFEKVLTLYKPAIIVWGKNDHIILEEAYRINQQISLNNQTRFVNLLKLHKNVYGLKDDLGLANAYKLYGYSIENQRHDALEDALMTYKIFKGFKAVLNGTKSIALAPLKE